MRTVLLPAALPKIFTGFRIGVALTLDAVELGVQLETSTGLAHRRPIVPRVRCRVAVVLETRIRSLLYLPAPDFSWSRSDAANPTGNAGTRQNLANLIHEFLSPLSNQRTDGYGGSFENRVRLLHRIADAVRREWPERLPLFVLISATDWSEGGWTIEESVELAKQLATRGVDVIDTTSGGIIRFPTAEPEYKPLYQVPLAQRIRSESGVPTVAVGGITTAAEAESVVAGGSADLVAIARRIMGDPYFPARAALELGETYAMPLPYARALL